MKLKNQKEDDRRSKPWQVRKVLVNLKTKDMNSSVDSKKVNPTDSAFPWTNDYNQAHGLTIRAYLAGKAMHGFISNGHIDDDFCAIRSLEMADALIARLNKDL